jgi:hypothetical protein
VLTELSKDSDCDVRRRAASNPNTPDFIDSRNFIITDTYVATKGTTNLWYKHKGTVAPFYTCGCFVGNHDQLVGKITLDGGIEWNERMQILSILDNKFNEVFSL